MFDTMIVLASSDMSELIIADLRRHHPTMRMIPIASGSELAALSPHLLANARLIGFTTPVIVPRAILAALGYGAYNFHPGPPSYPGLVPAQMAIYEGAQVYGATVHGMADKVDAGPIVAVEFCAIAPGATVVDVETQALGLLVRLLRMLGPTLVLDPRPLPLAPITWSPVKSSRRTVTELCTIPLDIDADELDRRIKAFAINDHGLHPTLTLHGHRFRYVDEAAKSEIAGDAGTTQPRLGGAIPGPKAGRRHPRDKAVSARAI